MTATATRGTKPTESTTGKEEKAKKPSFLKSKKAIIGLVALLAVGGGAYKFLAPTPPPPPPAGGAIVPMEATTLNLKGGHYLKVAVAIQLVEGKATVEEFKTSQAAELIIDEFSDRTVGSMSATADRTKLAKELEHKIKEAYEGEVFKIFLTQFVMQ